MVGGGSTLVWVREICRRGAGGKEGSPAKIKINDSGSTALSPEAGRIQPW